MSNTFAFNKNEFDLKYGNQKTIHCFLPVHLNRSAQASLQKKSGDRNEEYYKWQFMHSIIHSGLFPKDNIGTEIYFPKGNKNSAPIKMDGAIFDDASWFSKYEQYHNHKDFDALAWLREHLIVSIEIKKEDNKDIEGVWNHQLKPYLKESERHFCLGVIYDTERLYLFRHANGKYLRFSQEFNTKGENSKSGELTLHIPDPYINLIEFKQLESWDAPKTVNRTARNLSNLEIISGIHSIQINDAMSSILRKMDSNGLVNQKGFELFIQVLSLKIFDEKENDILNFYITEEEKNFKNIGDDGIQDFIGRYKVLRDSASGIYHRILDGNELDVRKENEINVLVEIISQFQDYSFVNSHKTDLYQLVFYKFAAPFTKDQNAQFVTPLPIIEFLVNVVNPRSKETVIDPTVGIADFLSVSYVNSESKLDDKNIFGMDIDNQMVMLATLNMLLNGDGNAQIESKSGYGSILTKFDHTGGLLDLDTKTNVNGDWDTRHDSNKLKKFDVVLTNPPFGDDRAFAPHKQQDKDVIACYELWGRYGNKGKAPNKIDLGVIFLENAYRILKEKGRLGIVLSNSIASVDNHREARRWLMEKMRIVAIFNLPANVFAETGVNTSVIVAYKPEEKELEQLKKDGYEIFSQEIKNVGYEVKTSKRVKYFDPIYKVNYDTFETVIDSDGVIQLDEDFSKTTADFKKWCVGQETTLRTLFIDNEPGSK